MVAIGIDLGTTYSAVGVMRNGKVDIIANDNGNRTTPSYVAFTGEERLVGEAAKNQAALNSTNTIFDAKYRVGNVLIHKYRVICVGHGNGGGNKYYYAEYKGEQKTFQPEEISSDFGKMKQTAEQYLVNSN